MQMRIQVDRLKEIQQDVVTRAIEIAKNQGCIPEDPRTCPLCELAGWDYGGGWYRCDDCGIEFHRNNHGRLDYLTFNLGGGPSKE